MPPIPVNPDLPISYAIPGIYGYISLLGTGPTPQNKRVMILGYQTSSGRADLAGVPVRLNNEDDAVNFTGKGSDVHRIYRAFQSQQGLGAEVWCCALTAPSGTAQTMTLTVTGTPTNATTLSVNTTAQAAGIWSLWIEGYRCDVIVANGDTYATVASNMLTQIQKVQDFLSVTATVSMATITLTARHAALSSADLPVI